MSADCKPGSFAVVTFRADDMRKAETLPGIRWASGWAIVDARGNYELIVDRIVSEVRPLVVLDPDDREACREFADRIAPNVVGNTNAVQAALRDMVRPPKPPEPQGLGAVVEDSEGVLWVRSSLDGEDNLGKPWKNGPVCKHWQIVDAVRVLSDGWEPKP